MYIVEVAKMPLISIVVPCYNEEAVLPQLYAELNRVSGIMDYVDFEYCFVDDGSADTTVEILRGYAASDKRVRFSSFSRNFGKEAAMLAGLRMATGDYVAVMDADLQHPPEMLVEMYAAVKDGEYDCAAARRTDREGETKVRSGGSRLFSKLMNAISDTEYVEGATDYRLMRRGMVEAVLSLPENNRFTKGIFSWVGFKTKWIPYVSRDRAAGETKWTFKKLVRYSVDGMMAFSTKPLALSSILGVIFCILAFISLIVTVIKTIIFGNPVAGYPTIVSLILLVGGLLMFFIGMLGQYLAKTYMEAKRRPLYIVRETEDGLK